ncbi:MAG TPA: YlmC/YmxH family sporulation protein [Candidatus Monoglobus merdigallinarum]|uniref:YlmC/YmxH family sporulation protein n=1 Tax=Candidatus Monoglobus merdigallinarum TaxID=2838698 RepID=A0A9D1TN40_9FIRM|nr:YlmC/YmxH family sporulation protein [Candidatus Monoglobus merdigallinarum]
MKFSELKSKEVICVSDGERLGFVYDIEFDEISGDIKSLLVPGSYHFLGLLGREDDVVVPWDKIEKIGDDLIIINKH